MRKHLPCLNPSYRKPDAHCLGALPHHKAETPQGWGHDHLFALAQAQDSAWNMPTLSKCLLKE